MVFNVFCRQDLNVKCGYYFGMKFLLMLLYKNEN